jgi:Flp pilus assembly protein TadG
MRKSAGKRAGGFLSRLRKDTAGNTLIIAAVAMLPMLGFAGAAIDMARVYTVKTRLQQACDAGALAGRRFMTDASVKTLETNAYNQAQTFFKNNFTSGWFALPSSSVNFTPYLNTDNQVSGNATAAVPMTIMGIFGQPTQTLTVTCAARFDTPDTDVMFVLDTTGSMACLPNGPDSCGQPNETYLRDDGTTGYDIQEKSGSRLQALRDAVMQFWDTVSATKDTSTQIRYGIVPYASSVNMGAALRAVDSTVLASGNVDYQSRHVTGEYETGFTKVSSNNDNQANCNATGTRSPSSSTTAFKADGTASYANAEKWVQTGGNYWNPTYQCQVGTRAMGPVWTYEQYNQNVANYVTFATVSDPTKFGGATSKWQGCIESGISQTVPGQTSYPDLNNLPNDLDPAFKPSSDAVRWRPIWPDVEYQRSGMASYAANDNASPASLGSSSLQSSGYAACGQPVMRLTKDTTLTRTGLLTYVNKLRALGGTYHDIGMTWGLRMIWPTGMFSADTATTTGRSTPHRVIVFVTDGVMSPNASVYGAYGMEYYDRRVTGSYFGTSDPDGTTSNLNAYTNFHNARFLAECAKAKQVDPTTGSPKVDIWVVAVGAQPDSSSALYSCATNTSMVKWANTSDALKTAFNDIAKQVAMLRVYQ